MEESVSPQHLLQDVLSYDGLLLRLEDNPLLLLPLVPATQSAVRQECFSADFLAVLT